MRTIFDALRAMVYMAGFVLLWGWMALSVRVYDERLGVVLPAWTSWFGIPLMLLGGILVLLCGATFVVRGRGTPAPFDAPRQFVASGPYKYVRNPMYIGAGVLLVGLGLYLHSVSILILSAGGLLLAHAFVVFYEEPTLREKFGSGYRDYCNSVSRWIPGPRRT